MAGPLAALLKRRHEAHEAEAEKREAERAEQRSEGFKREADTERRRLEALDRLLPTEVLALREPVASPFADSEERLHVVSDRLRVVGAQVAKLDHVPPSLARERTNLLQERDDLTARQAEATEERGRAWQAQREAARGVARQWAAGYCREKLTPPASKVFKASAQLDEALADYAEVYAPIERCGQLVGRPLPGLPASVTAQLQGYRDGLERLRAGLTSITLAARQGGD